MLLPSIFGENFFEDIPTPLKNLGLDKKLYGKNVSTLMKTDVVEKDGGYEIDIDLPGVKKEEITADIQNGYLVVKVNKTVDEEKKDSEGKVLCKERYAGSMERRIYLGDAVNKEDVKAKYEDGVLKISVPKKEIEMPKESPIAIE